MFHLLSQQRLSLLSKTVSQSLAHSLPLSVCHSAMSYSLIQSLPLLLSLSLCCSFTHSSLLSWFAHLTSMLTHSPVFSPYPSSAMSQLPGLELSAAPSGHYFSLPGKLLCSLKATNVFFFFLFCRTLCGYYTLFFWVLFALASSNLFCCSTCRHYLCFMALSSSLTLSHPFPFYVSLVVQQQFSLVHISQNMSLYGLVHSVSSWWTTTQYERIKVKARHKWGSVCVKALFGICVFFGRKIVPVYKIVPSCLREFPNSSTSLWLILQVLEDPAHDRSQSHVTER